MPEIRNASQSPGVADPAAALDPPLPEGASGWTVESSFAYCARIAREHYENFPVGSILVPRASRPHVHAVYAYARAADDFADEMKDPPRQLALLDSWQAELERAFAGEARHPVFIALKETARALEIPIQPFQDLLTAYRMDVTTSRYETWEDVIHYCRHSANPVGQLVLYIHGHREAELHRLSDSICTALQLANFWQDVEVDWRKDRVYIPQTDMRVLGVTEKQLADGKVDEAYRACLERQVGRTRALFLEGRPLCDRLRGRLALEIRATWLGGMTILERVEEAGYDVWRRRPVISTRDKLSILGRAIFWRRP